LGSLRLLGGCGGCGGRRSRPEQVSDLCEVGGGLDPNSVRQGERGDRHVCVSCVCVSSRSARASAGLPKPTSACHSRQTLSSPPVQRLSNAHNAQGNTRQGSAPCVDASRAAELHKHAAPCIAKGYEVP